MSLRNNSVWASFFVGAVVGGFCISWLWSEPRPVYAAERLSLASIDARLFALETLLADVTLDPNGDLVIEGVNLHIRSGSGATDSEVNGRGNLIVGYDEVGDFGSDKSGSHNVVIGTGHSYISYGGLVAGYQNQIVAPYASVSGGEHNTASGPVSSVNGGRFNTASGDWSSVSGGQSNTASTFLSSVSGGYANTASGEASSVSGGGLNVASGGFSTVSGGGRNTAGGYWSTVGGGDLRETTGDFSWRAGGLLEAN